MPNRKINKIVRYIDRGSVVFNVNSYYSPHNIVKLGSGDYDIIPSNCHTTASVIARGYRWTPSHWEWVVLLNYHLKTNPIFVKTLRSACETGNFTKILPVGNADSIAVKIIKQDNKTPERGGVPVQVAVYLRTEVNRFKYVPSQEDLVQQINYAYQLYGWDNASSGLYAEIFSRVTGTPDRWP